MDPSGHDGCAADDRACWEDEWYWKNRWYEAHGFAAGNGHWNVPIDAKFADEGILLDVLAEVGISAAGDWGDWEKGMTRVAQGVVKLMNTVGGADALRALFDPPGLLQGSASVTIKRGTDGLGNCAGQLACSLYNTVWFFDKLFTTYDDPDFVRGTAVHELAHIIDHKHMARRASLLSQSFPGFGGAGSHLTVAGGRNGFEYWAEAVTIWVYGDRYKGPGGAYNEDRRGFLSPLQVSILEGWLGGG